ncbi:aldehyde dehydrogenase [Ramicandelaber brevisporus]|nr:aldehyde dehydrogenase [Ramicandelaber brevisporus]
MASASASSSSFTVYSPAQPSEPLLSRKYTTRDEAKAAISACKAAFKDWRDTPLEQRAAIISRFVDNVEKDRDVLAKEITAQMGRPIRYTAGEINGLATRARFLISAAQEALAPTIIDADSSASGFKRSIRREPLGVIMIISPWNYPYLTAVNAVVPALLAGNSVYLKHSPQTPLVAERFKEYLSAAGLPAGVFNIGHLSNEDTNWVIESLPVDFVSFTGSVDGGKYISRAAANRVDVSIGTGLELGGKDAAYVRSDADLDSAVENVIDGAFFNSGQSCCAVERIYVHESLFDEFTKKAAELTAKYIVGNPFNKETTLGPLVRPSAADKVWSHVESALAAGAEQVVDLSGFPEEYRTRNPTGYIAPQIFINVDHGMDIMKEETFGPVVGIMKVKDDNEAIKLINDSNYGLTASVWTSDLDKAEQIGDKLEVGTVFMNRCDYLDPALAWAGVKLSGRGCTLSVHGFDQFTRLKSYHLKI